MPRQLKRGFTLIEVLVTLVILTFGLLGIAGLMAKGQRIAFEAYQRQQAVALATDMGERILGNRMLAATCPPGPGCTTYIAGAPVLTPLGAGLSYNQYLTGGTKDCAAAVCSVQELSLYDLALWDGLLNGYGEQQAVGGARVGGIVNARGCIQELANTSGACAGPGAAYTSSIRVSVSWQGNDETATPTGANSNCGTGLYGVEAKRRIVTYDLMVQQTCP
ncbi:MAG: type pilus modification protein PilV [Betaproteobacteria bacterium]|nr:type pilus modification protein PilV [Betaproteobacteria bacterium]